MIDIQGNLYDFWEVRSVEKGIRYNDDDVKEEYLIILNKTSTSTNVNEVVFVYDTEEERDTDLANLKAKLQDHDTVVLV